MTSRTTYSVRLIGRIGPAMAQMLAVSAMALAVSACRPDEEPGAHVAGWAAIDPGQRHPIIVSQQPAHMSLRISRGATGLTSQQRANVVDFMNRYRGGDQGNGRIVVTVPSGTPNEIAALHAVAELRDMLREYAIDDSRVSVQPQRGDPEPQPPIRISYARYIAEGPSCGKWPANIADDTRNLPYHDLGCSTQHNIAAQIANPGDLLGPRTMGQGAGERRDVTWEKWIKGESTNSEKKSDEKAQTKNTN